MFVGWLVYLAVRDKTYEEALKEMMERIKSGRALKSTNVEVGQQGASIFGERDLRVRLWVEY